MALGLLPPLPATSTVVNGNTTFADSNGIVFDEAALGAGKLNFDELTARQSVVCGSGEPHMVGYARKSALRHETIHAPA